MTASVRKDVLSFIARYPGAHVREVERQLGLSSKLASYHLQQLEQAGAVKRVEDGGYARFVSASLLPTLSRRDLAAILLLRREPVLRIATLLLSEGTLSQGAISDKCDLPAASASYHLKAMLEAGVAQVEPAGRARLYSLADPDRLRRLLQTYEPLPGETDAFSAMWNDLFR